MVVMISSLATLSSSYFLYHINFLTFSIFRYTSFSNSYFPYPPHKVRAFVILCKAIFILSVPGSFFDSSASIYPHIKWALIFVSSNSTAATASSYPFLKCLAAFQHLALFEKNTDSVSLISIAFVYKLIAVLISPFSYAIFPSFL